MIVLVTGGLGYIGSHACVALLEAGYDVVVLDNLATGKEEVVTRIEKITGRRLVLVIGDIRDRSILNKVFDNHDIGAVLHFAGLKSPSESLLMPLAYFDCNVTGSITLLEEMQKRDIKTLVFSSSATVYGLPEEMPVTESCRAESPTNPYGKSKLMVEQVLRDLTATESEWRVACLRYFNPVSAHRSGLLGEDPVTAPNNLMPYVTRVAAGRLSELTVFGDDYPTSDGTGVRDYIHVQDLAEGHVATLRYLTSAEGFSVFNLGTGRGISVLELIRKFEEVSGKPIPYTVGPRRQGDVAECWADPAKAQRLMGWQALLTIDDMCRDAWQWEQNCQSHV
ncbi:UDP-glucose 4-epimerase GalE [Pseudohongiella acticola]|uniref:UDP-glucose 4-epimerase n=1 Tax=Pseudohongiella acticola TaxID=1524254 RepID=A0A1E8CH54_9GAMM|nr:UDP-glucose 4-epimerase GalE [Pseudohongiella acticola]OFE11761.1 UDP-glucose 4-epimerase GalE [Pseudohongiella acticola]